MKFIIITAIALASLGWFGYLKYEGYCNNEPLIEHPIEFDEMVPQNVPVKIEVDGRSGKYIIGHRIETQNYFLISTTAGLSSEHGKVFDAPALVPKGIISSFDKLVLALEEDNKVKGSLGNIKNVKGDQLYKEDGKTPLLFEKKQVVILYSATYDNHSYAIDRRRCDN